MSKAREAVEAAQAKAAASSAAAAAATAAAGALAAVAAAAAATATATATATAADGDGDGGVEEAEGDGEGEEKEEKKEGEGEDGSAATAAAASAAAAAAADEEAVKAAMETLSSVTGDMEFANEMKVSARNDLHKARAAVEEMQVSRLGCFTSCTLMVWFGFQTHHTHTAQNPTPPRPPCRASGKRPLGQSSRS